MNKRERVMAAVQGHAVDSVPAGFWYHFPAACHHGEAAVNIHREFLEQTDTDILKIMNENLIPCQFPILSSKDWKHMRPISADADFIQEQADIVKRIVDAVDGEAAVIVTIHGTVASAYHARRGPENYEKYGAVLRDHLRERPQLVGRAFAIAAEGAAEMTRQCLAAGADGIYYAALGGESYLYSDEEFAEFIRPHDLVILETAQIRPGFNILHMCKDRLNLRRYAGYPADVVNWGVHSENPTLQQGKRLFPGSAVLGGLDDRDGVLVQGSLEEIEQAVFALLDNMGMEQFLLGADCTLPTNTDYSRIRAAIRAARRYSPPGNSGSSSADGRS